MSTPTSPLGPFLGMNNRLPAEKLSIKEGDFVVSAVNVNITNSGTFERRDGTEKVISGDDCHSFWTDGTIGFFVDHDKLYHVYADVAGISRNEILTVVPGVQWSYAKVNDEVYASNGVQLIRIDADANVFDATVQPPNTVPSMLAQTGGSLPEGIYQVALSYSLADGQESPTTVPVSTVVPADGVVVLSNLPSIAGATTNIYMTPCNGDIFYRVGSVSSSSYVVSMEPTSGVRPTGLLMAPTPPGTIVRYLNGRLLVASGSVLFYSDPYNLGMYDPVRGYILMPEPITMVEPCQNGFYMSADQTYWVSGDVASADLNPVLPYKAVARTSGPVPNTNSAWWMSDRGTVLGTQDGQVENLQEKTVAVDPAIVGASLFREQDGMKQMISTLFSPQSTVMAASSFMDAEVIRKETVL